MNSQATPGATSIASHVAGPVSLVGLGFRLRSSQPPDQRQTHPPAFGRWGGEQRLPQSSSSSRVRPAVMPVAAAASALSLKEDRVHFRKFGGGGGGCGGGGGLRQ